MAQHKTGILGSALRQFLSALYNTAWLVLQTHMCRHKATPNHKRECSTPAAWSEPARCSGLTGTVFSHYRRPQQPNSPLPKPPQVGMSNNLLRLADGTPLDARRSWQCLRSKQQYLPSLGTANGCRCRRRPQSLRLEQQLKLWQSPFLKHGLKACWQRQRPWVGFATQDEFFRQLREARSPQLILGVPRIGAGRDSDSNRARPRMADWPAR